MTSVKCVENSYKNVPVIIPKSINSHLGSNSNAGHRNVRLSIQGSENEDKSFLGDEEFNEDSTKNYSHNHNHSVSSCHNNVRA